MELGGEADLGVGRAPVGKVLHQLSGYPGEGLRVLHHLQGQLEALQVLVDAGAVRRRGQIRPVAGQVRRRHGDALPFRQLPDRLRSEGTIQVQVQLHLGKIKSHALIAPFLSAAGGQMPNGQNGKKSLY